MSVLQKIDLPIEGMTCISCVAHVESALSDVDGVLSVNVNLATERVEISFLSNIANVEDFKKAVAEIGYKLIMPDIHESLNEVNLEGK